MSFFVPRPQAASQAIPYGLRLNILFIKLCAIAHNIDIRTNSNVAKVKYAAPLTSETNVNSTIESSMRTMILVIAVLHYD